MKDFIFCFNAFSSRESNFISGQARGHASLENAMETDSDIRLERWLLIAPLIADDPIPKTGSFSGLCSDSASQPHVKRALAAMAGVRLVETHDQRAKLGESKPLRDLPA